MNRKVYEINGSGHPLTYKTKTMEKGYTDANRHFEKIKIVHVTLGSGKWNINGTDVLVTKDDILFFSPKDKRYIAEVTDDHALSIEQIEFLPITLYPIQYIADFFYSAKRNNLVPGETPKHYEILKLFSKIRKAIEENIPFKDEYIKNLLLTAVLCIAQSFNADEKAYKLKSNSQYSIVCKAIQYIGDNLCGDLSRENLSKKLWVSPCYLSRIFKEYSGFTLQDYISSCRVQNVIYLLENNKMSITDAAYNSGFGSLSGFYRAFRAITGKTPKEFYIE